MRVDTVSRDDVPILYTAEVGSPDAISEAARRAFARLERAIPPRGRRIYGYWDPPSGLYRACYGLADEDRPEALGLERGVIPGGLYRRARLRGEGVYGRIGETFDALAESAAVEPGRPWLEFYRRHDEVDLLVPIAPETEPS